MPFGSQKKSRASLIRGLCACAVLALCGCASMKQSAQKIWPWGEQGDDSALVVADAKTRIGEEVVVPELEPTPVLPESSEMLVYWETIRGGFSGRDSRAMSVADMITGGDYVELVNPIAIALRENYLYILDEGLGLVLRYDKSTARMDRLVELYGVTAGEPADIYVAKDFSFYVADTFGSRVLHFSAKGKLLRTFQNKLNLARPVAVAEDAASGNILVADAYFDHVLVFTEAGELVGAVGGRGEDPGQFLNITSMAVGPDGFYVGARVGQRVQVLSGNGDYLYSLDQSGVVFPYAMAVDQNFHVFLGDYIDNSIKIFSRGKFITSIGRTGVGPGQFKRITDLTVAGEFLYVADSLNGRIQVLRVVETAPSPIAAQPEQVAK